jgi:molybdopterin-guanine dinucleotide biosynthesis protein MobB
MATDSGTSTKTPVVSIVGLSGSGKTTLVERLISLLSGRGLRVGTIKHSRHPHPMDMPGKDSWRHKQAGAERTLFLGPECLQIVMDVHGEQSPYNLTEKYLSGLDLVIVEGFLHFEMQKIEVVRSARSTEPKSSPADGLIALASDLSPEELGGHAVPVFNLDNAEGIADFLLQHFSITPVVEGA